MWAGVVDAAPSGAVLNASYSTASTTAFQDGLGQVLLRTCQVAPDGVLLFVPSYR